MSFLNYANSHFDSLYFDPPRICGLIEGGLHGVADGLPLGEDLGQVLGAQYVPQRCRCQQMRWVTASNIKRLQFDTWLSVREPAPEILNVVRGHGRIGDAVVNDGVHGYSYRISWQYLKGISKWVRSGRIWNWNL